MAASREALGFIALTRFGYGARGDGDLSAAGSDPRGFIKAELGQPGIALLEGPDLQPTPKLLQAMFADQQRVKLEREKKASDAAAAPKPDNSMGAAAMSAPAIPAAPAMAGADNVMATAPPAALAKPAPQPPNIEQQTFRAEALARLQRAMQARAGLTERLVAFWSNHFCVSARKSQFSRITCGSFEREAIRPHVLGRFADMLKAVEQHPAMLHFLDNQQSIGPGSKAGQNRKTGLNENLAREIMELHTIGVGSGYTQGDVTNLAKIITGWTVVGRDAKPGEPGTFIFNANAHEPGEQILLGKAYAATGQAQGEAALADIARQPACANFIASKFTRHFVADDPPPAIVQRLAKAFRDSDGDLRVLTLTLLDSDEAWDAPLAKLRNPYEFLVAALRMGNRVIENADQALSALNLMGMPLWQVGGPNGWPDNVAAWASPEGMKQRLDTSALIASRWKEIPNPLDLLNAVAGNAASAETKQAVSRAESRQQGLALLLMSPEMQRR